MRMDIQPMLSQLLRATSVFGLTDSVELARPTKVCALHPFSVTKRKCFAGKQECFARSGHWKEETRPRSYSVSSFLAARPRKWNSWLFSNRGVGMRYWWVNQNQTFRQEIAGGYLWSPKRN